MGKLFEIFDFDNVGGKSKTLHVEFVGASLY